MKRHRDETGNKPQQLTLAQLARAQGGHVSVFDAWLYGGREISIGGKSYDCYPNYQYGYSFWSGPSVYDCTPSDPE